LCVGEGGSGRGDHKNSKIKYMHLCVWDTCMDLVV